MSATCGAQTHDVHGDVVCDLDPDHPGAHSGEVVGGVVLCWSAAPPLSPREREIVARFENAVDPYADEHAGWCCRGYHPAHSTMSCCTCGGA